MRGLGIDVIAAGKLSIISDIINDIGRDGVGQSALVAYYVPRAFRGTEKKNEHQSRKSA